MSVPYNPNELVTRPSEYSDSGNDSKVPYMSNEYSRPYLQRYDPRNSRKVPYTNSEYNRHAARVAREEERNLAAQVRGTRGGKSKRRKTKRRIMKRRKTRNKN
jgi:hypothetical protein